MGMDADIIGIGHFFKELARHLDYPAELYKNTPEGAEITTVIFGCSSTQSSRALAYCLGVDPWKFEEHKLVISQDTLDSLVSFAIEYSMKEDLEDLKALHIAGFRFYYRPNG